MCTYTAKLRVSIKSIDTMEVQKLIELNINAQSIVKCSHLQDV